MEIPIPQRKRQILQYVNDHSDSTPQDVSKALGISIENAQMHLFRLYRAVLISRPKTRKLRFTYTINDRGEARLTHWAAKESARRKAKE